jgi:hypothetical protein
MHWIFIGEYSFLKQDSEAIQETIVAALGEMASTPG